jgi:cation transport protein ChaC
LVDGREVTALAYVINRENDQYCNFDLEKQAQIIAAAVGGRGPNTDYLYNTAQRFDELGVEDGDMRWLVTRVQQIAGENT